MKSKLVWAAAFIILFFQTASVEASVLYSQALVLHSGWSIVSTPKILESHSFSASEISGNFDIYVLNATSTIGWSTMAQVGQTEFTPLYGYFINNKTGSDQTLTLNYKADVSPLSRIFERSFPATGWYSIGIANPTYATKLASSTVSDTNNPDQILSAITSYDNVIDFTDASSTTPISRNSVALVEPWEIRTKAQVNLLTDFRETKGYAMHINQTGSTYTGFQDNVAQATVATSSVDLSLNSANFPSAEIVADQGAGSNEYDAMNLLAFDLKANGADLYVNDIVVNIATSGSTATGTTVYLYKGASLISSQSLQTHQNFVEFPSLSESITKDSTVTYTVKMDVRTATTNQTTFVASVTPIGITGQDIYGVPIDKANGTNTVAGENMYVRTVGPILALNGVSLGSVSRSTDGFGNSTSTVSATFNIQVTAKGGDIIFGSSASTTRPLIGSNLIEVYKNGVLDGTSYSRTAIFDVPSSGVVVDGPNNSFTLSMNNTVTIPVQLAITVTGPAIGANIYSIGLGGVAWKSGSTVATSTFMAGKTTWRSSSVALP